MREILFKAKRLDDGKWIEGYYQKRFDSIGKLQHLIFHCESSLVWEYAEIDPDTLCEFTGLTDFFGNKIFEHDIVEERTGTYRKFKITYDKDAFCIDGHDIMLRIRNAQDKIKIIGNIFDNSELLTRPDEFTERHVNVMKSAIGLNNKDPYTRHGKKFYKPYRNRFNTYHNNELWQVLEKAGLASHENWNGDWSELIDFHVTRKGLDWLGERLGIHIYDEED